MLVVCARKNIGMDYALNVKCAFYGIFYCICVDEHGQGIHPLVFPVVYQEFCCSLTSLQNVIMETTEMALTSRIVKLKQSNVKLTKDSKKK